MTDIAIRPLQRTELPPSRVGAVKPPLSLADKSGEIGLAVATAKFAGDRYNNVVKAKSANEHAEFQGIAAAEMEAFDTFVVSKPGASFEELEAERNKMVARIEAAGKKATTKLAQQDNKNWMLRNKGIIYNQTQTSMEAIRTRQALDVFNLHRKNLITNFKDNELTDLYGGQVESGLMTKEFADAQLEGDLDVMEAAQSKVAVGNASQVGFEAWQATVTPEDPDGDLNIGFNTINAMLGLTGAEKQDAESQMKTRISNRRAEAKLEQGQAADAATDEVNEKLNKGEFDGIDAFINSQDGITETQKNKLITHANAFTKAVNDAKEDTVTTDETNISIDRIIDDVRNGRRTYEEGIAAYSELASGIKASEGASNLDDIRRAADFSLNEATTRQVVKNGQSVTGRMRAVEIAMVNANTKLDDAERLPLIAAIEARFFRYQTQLDEWAIANNDDPNFNEKYQKQVNTLFRPEIERVTLSALQSFLRVKETTQLTGVARFGKALSTIIGTTEEAALSRKRFKALGKHPVFQTMTAKEKDDAKKLFRSGSTLAEVVALLEGE